MASETNGREKMDTFLDEFARSCADVYFCARNATGGASPDRAHEVGIAAVNAYAQWIGASDPKEVATSLLRLAEERGPAE